MKISRPWFDRRRYGQRRYSPARSRTVRVEEELVADARVPATGRSGIREVAAAAGVSESTVSNVLNNPQIVAAKTRRRVERAMEELDFVRNRAAGQLRGAPSSVVGSIVLDSANPFFAEVA
ncbi:LacI family DNA-binding transcriptional regulator, partial [Dactylosporangium matsuzakiense]|uniref:LacI family DNA-binding transcriptional regulator n=1 Tax=Dactylosporangium matsuzakiense TaxID=53360 RepID=UPI0022F30A9B